MTYTSHVNSDVVRVRPVERTHVTRSELRVENLTIECDIGVYEHEIGVPQPLIITVILQVDPCGGDDIHQVFNYANIVEYAKALAVQRIGLIETFAQRLAENCLEHPFVFEADVSVSKPRALDNGLAVSRLTLKAARRD